MIYNTKNNIVYYWSEQLEPPEKQNTAQLTVVE